MADSSRVYESDLSGKLPSAASNDSRALKPTVDSGRTVLVGILGGIASAIGYTIYQRLPDEQRERLHAQVRAFASSRLNEFRATLNL